MHMPSARVRSEMNSEHASTWYVPANGGSELAFLMKLPTAVIKALVSGAELRLTFGRAGAFLCKGAQVLDIPGHAVCVSGPQRHEEEHEALIRALRAREVPVFLFNEMDVCLAWTNLRISEEHASSVMNLMGDPDALYVGPLTPEVVRALDCFCVSIDPSDKYPGAAQIPVLSVPVCVEAWRITQAVFVGNHEYHAIQIDHANEGEILERAVWVSLESVFPMTLHKSPTVEIGAKRRELTDVLAFYERGCFLIEAKDLSVIQAQPDRTIERRVAGVQKQVKSAMKQLVGASKAVGRGERVFDVSGRELNLPRDWPSHCIVLVTELMHQGDWSAVEAALVAAIRSTGSYFHLLDLDELITLLKLSSGRAELLDYHLLKRFEMFHEVKSVHIRTRPVP